MFTNGSFRQFQLKPNPQTGNYLLHHLQTIPLITNDSLELPSKKRRVEPVKSFQVNWNPCLTEVNEKCFSYLSKGSEGSWIIHFVQSEYMNELTSLSLEVAPSSLISTKTSLFIIESNTVSVSSISLSSLSLCEILK